MLDNFQRITVEAVQELVEDIFMSTKTIEQKARAYDEALNQAKFYHGNCPSEPERKKLEKMFPVLCESEDERIRKRLIEYFEGFRMGNAEVKWEGLTIQEVLAWLEKREEQKPVQSEVEREYVRTLKSLISDFLRGKEDVDREYYQQIFDWLDGRNIEQKPVDFPTTDEEVNEFLETHSKVEVPEKYKTPDFVFSKQEYKSYPIISKDTTSVKPAEWSAKGRRGRIGSTPEHIRKKAENFLSKMEPPYDADDICSAYETGAMENANSSWSEEDEKMLRTIISDGSRGVELDSKQISWLNSSVQLVKNPYNLLGNPARSRWNR